MESGQGESANGGSEKREDGQDDFGLRISNFESDKTGAEDTNTDGKCGFWNEE